MPTESLPRCQNNVPQRYSLLRGRWMQNCNNRHLFAKSVKSERRFRIVAKRWCVAGFIIRRNSVKKTFIALISSISDGDRTQREPNPICKVLYLQTKKYHWVIWPSVLLVQFGASLTRKLKSVLTPPVFPDSLSLQRISWEKKPDGIC